MKVFMVQNMQSTLNHKNYVRAMQFGFFSFLLKQFLLRAVHTQLLFHNPSAQNKQFRHL